jgi:hypothetical protein
MARHDDRFDRSIPVFDESPARSEEHPAYGSFIVTPELSAKIQEIDQEKRIEWVSLAAHAIVDHHRAEVVAADDRSLINKAAQLDSEKNFLLVSLRSEKERRMALMLAQLEIGPVKEPGEDEDTGMSN